MGHYDYYYNNTDFLADVLMDSYSHHLDLGECDHMLQPHLYVLKINKGKSIKSTE